MKKNPWIILLLLLTPSLCYAYVGPGVGLSVISSLLALGSAFFITVFGFIWLPIKRFFTGEKNNSDENGEDENTDTDEKNSDGGEDDNQNENDKNEKP